MLGDVALARHVTVHGEPDGASPAPVQVLARSWTQIDTWDPSEGTFVRHAVAGSIGGVAEHTCMFPLDTVKTMMQTRGSTAPLAELLRQHGPTRLWAGVQTMFTGCIPAHALYFSIYEGVMPKVEGRLASRGASEDTAATLASGAAVAVASVAHDLIMTPLDVCKQRIQIGATANDMCACALAVKQQEGMGAFFRSLPVTVLMNMPYAAVVGTVNEAIRRALAGPDGGPPDWSVFVVSGGGAGAIAAFATNPLDVIKTRLQTQACSIHSTAAVVAGEAGGSLAASGRGGRRPPANVVYRGVADTFAAILAEGGWRGFFRGAGVRMMTHAPAVSISWTTYETAKRFLDSAAARMGAA